jgi:IS30 family transposase
LSERSIQNRLNTLAKIKHRQLKLLQYPLLQQYVTLRLKQKYSLKVIGSVIELHPELVDGIVCFKTLYNAIDDNRISFIDRKALRHIRKRKQRHKPHGKRMNGPSIETRTEEINDRKTFAHFEGDLIEGKRGTNCHLLTLCERLSRKGFAIKIFGKCPESVLKAIEKLQLDKVLNFGINIKSLTLDNGVEF